MSDADGKAPDRVVVGRYRLESVLGRGGMGVVWRAVDTLIERTVALKELRAPTAVTGDESFRERALREARNAGRLNHPGVVAVHDVIAPSGDDDAIYIVMEYVQAPTLAELIEQQGPLPAPRVATMGVGIVEALMAAHAMGIVHRDIKPSNVLVRDGDRVKLTDFGIALAAEDARLTRSGVMGTHAYLAPEAFEAGQVGPAADLWALGATLFHAVAGRAPFERDSTTATLRAILFEDPPPPPCPPALAEVITGLLTRPVEQRLTGEVAREKLERVAAEPTAAPTVDMPSTGGADRSGWRSQATTFHRRPPDMVPPPPPPPPAPPPGPVHGVPTGGRPQPPRPAKRNNAPVVIGAVAVATAVLLVLVMIASGGGGPDSDGDAGAPGTTTVSDPGVTTDPASEAAEGEALATEFLDAVNSRDESTAIGMLCPDTDSSYAESISTAIDGNVSVQIEETVVNSELSFTADLAGTLNGEPLSYGALGVNNDPDVGWCILIFSAL